MQKSTRQAALDALTAAREPNPQLQGQRARFAVDGVWLAAWNSALAAVLSSFRVLLDDLDKASDGWAPPCDRAHAQTRADGANRALQALLRAKAGGGVRIPRATK